MPRTVEFTVEDGVTLRGRMYAGSSQSGSPGVVMTHGFSGVIEQIEHYAEYFAAGGLSVLIYDHRGFGASDGTPRQEVDPHRQQSDWRDAITYARSQPEFLDDATVGIWGSSFAGGLALVVAACDPRVGAVVSQIPHVSGPRNAQKLFTESQLNELAIRAGADRAGRLSARPPQTLPVFSADPSQLCALPVSSRQGWITAVESVEDTNWRNVVTLRSVEHFVEYEPAGWISYIAPKPLLMIIADSDDCTFPDVQHDVFLQAGTPKKLLRHPGGHFETYAEHFTTTSAAARDWFTEHLRSSSER